MTDTVNPAKSPVIYTVQFMEATKRYRLFYKDAAGWQVHIGKMPMLMKRVTLPCIFRVILPDCTVLCTDKPLHPMDAEVKGIYGVTADGSIDPQSTVGKFLACLQCGSGAWHEFVEPDSSHPMIKVCANPECRAPITYSEAEAESIRLGTQKNTTVT